MSSNFVKLSGARKLWVSAKNPHEECTVLMPESERSPGGIVCSRTVSNGIISTIFGSPLKDKTR